MAKYDAFWLVGVLFLYYNLKQPTQKTNCDKV